MLCKLIRRSVFYIGPSAITSFSDWTLCENGFLSRICNSTGLLEPEKKSFCILKMIVTNQEKEQFLNKEVVLERS